MRPWIRLYRIGLLCQTLTGLKWSPASALRHAGVCYK